MVAHIIGAAARPAGLQAKLASSARPSSASSYQKRSFLPYLGVQAAPGRVAWRSQAMSAARSPSSLTPA